MRKITLALLVASICLILGQYSQALAQSIKFGVLANKGAQEAFRKWKPMTDYMKAKSGQDIVLAPLNFKQLTEAFQKGEIDIATSNPGMYIFFREKYGVYPIVTTSKKGIPYMGGVILVKKDSSINSLAQLRGKNISIVSFKSLGGYVLQAYLFKKNGIDLSKECKLKPYRNQDHVVFSVLNGVADAGFVRTNQLESMVKRGLANLDDYKIIHSQRHENFPYLASTDLVPAWPFFVMQRVDKGFVKKVESALLSLTSSSPEAKAAGISGFIPPGDYEPVAEALRSLGMEPF